MDQDLRRFLKRLNIQESTVSTVLGVLVVLITAGLIFNYWRTTRRTSETVVTPTPTVAPGEVRLVEKDGQMVPAGLPTTHKVVAGEHLWGIAEKYFGTGYNWVDIAEANDLRAPYAVSADQELTIPQVAVKQVDGEVTPTVVADAATVTPRPTNTTAPSPTSGEEPTSMPTGATGVTSPTPTTAPTAETISGNTYTVVQGDHLWNIAVRAYGDGYKWVDIYQANKEKIANANLIYPDQELVLPR